MGLRLWCVMIVHLNMLDVNKLDEKGLMRMKEYMI